MLEMTVTTDQPRLTAENDITVSNGVLVRSILGIMQEEMQIFPLVVGG